MSDDLPKVPAHLDEETAKVWEELVAAHHDPLRIIGADFDAYCAQVALQRDCRQRIAEEGAIVTDERDRPAPHPAIDLERDAQKEIRAWGDRFRPKVARAAGERRTR